MVFYLKGLNGFSKDVRKDASTLENENTKKISMENHSPRKPFFLMQKMMHTNIPFHMLNLNIKKREINAH